MGEVADGDGVGEFGQLAQDAVEDAADFAVVPVGLAHGQRARVHQAQAGDAIQQVPVPGAGQGAFALAREPVVVLEQLIELKEERAGIGVVQ